MSETAAIYKAQIGHAADCKEKPIVCVHLKISQLVLANSQKEWGMPRKSSFRV